MSARPSRPFRRRLFLATLAASLAPLLLCSAMLVQIFRLRMSADAEKDALDDLNRVLQTLDSVSAAAGEAADALNGDPVITAALTGGEAGRTQVYAKLFDAADRLRAFARLDLYDNAGIWRYSTHSGSAAALATDWGVLCAARRAGALTFLPGEEGESVLLRAAAPLRSGSGRAVGYLVVSLTRSGLDALLEGVCGASSDLLLLSRYWDPVYCTQAARAETVAPLLRQRLLEKGSVEGVSEDFLYSVGRHEGTGLYAVLERPQVFTRATLRMLYTVSLGCALICVAVSVLLSLRLSRQLSRPIERLRRGMEQVGGNNLDVTVQPEGGDELGELALRFNGMVADLKRNQEALVENQRELDQAQIRMLQAQLNPHFLCNTLDTMKWISKIHQVPQVAVMATDLADILRFGISPEEFVPLGREARLLERYLEIQRIRLSGDITFTLDLPEELSGCPVPKMMLQPIVENAILHGLEGMDRGEILLTAREEPAGTLRICVADNGGGLPPEMVGPYRRRPEQGGRLGLYNVHTILRKYYGTGSGLYLDNRPGGKGAVITAVLPLSRGDAEEEERPC